MHRSSDLPWAFLWPLHLYIADCLWISPRDPVVNMNTGNPPASDQTLGWKSCLKTATWDPFPLAEGCQDSACQDSAKPYVRVICGTWESPYRIRHPGNREPVPPRGGHRWGHCRLFGNFSLRTVFLRFPKLHLSKQIHKVFCRQVYSIIFHLKCFKKGRPKLIQVTLLHSWTGCFSCDSKFSEKKTVCGNNELLIIWVEFGKLIHTQ